MINFFTYLAIVAVIVLIILIATYFINMPSNDYEKRSAYECGFEPFGDARSFFDIQFYLVGLLFIVFDLEIVFLIPFVMDIYNTSAFGLLNFLAFMSVVILGLVYEFSTGLLS
jgi:NADH:ubiquinone oxidoreductase subunit 3 (subunit A)